MVKKIVIPTLGEPGVCEAALRKKRIKYQTRPVGSGTEYGHMLADLWREGEGFLMMEHDIIPRGRAAVPALCKCPEPWCSHAYLAPVLHISLGVLKLTTEALQASQDLPVIWEGAHWGEIDRLLIPALLGRFPLHGHFPPFGHERFDG